ncbi:hypothetical protein PoB_001820100 [Plakobranchus ocellatus]|uniref:Uncharacterized protein n=1 Tax=Plakobranchus ocellatus TaxID=259542 RepID=A0AAV3Z729_9GAST|nr:hypothetical protein PoB_001820100 [Plakobranchus ocellatus]
MIPKSQSQSSIFDRGKSTSHGLFRSECESEFCTTTSTRQNDSSNSNKEKNCSRTFICNNGVKKIVPVSRSSGNFKSVYGSPSHETPGNEKYAEKCALLSERDQKRFAHQNENPTQGSQLCCSQTDSKSNMFWCNEKNKSFAVEITTSQCRNKSDQCTWTNIGNSGVRGEERDAVFNRQDFLSSDRQSKILTAKNQRSGQNYYFNSEFGSSTRHPMQMILHSDKSNQHQTTYKDFSVQADKTIFITPKENHHHRDFHLGLIDSSQGLPMNRTGPDSQYWAIKTHPKNFITDFTCKTGDAQNSYRNLRLEKCIVAHLDHGEVDFSQATLDSKSRIRHGTELPESYTSHSYNGLEYYRIGSICGTPLPAASCSPEPLSSYTSMYAGRVSSARSTRSRSYWSRVTSTRSISRVSNFRTHSGEIGNGYKTLRQTTRKKLVDGNERHVLSGTGFYTETPRTLKGEAGEGEGGVENENKSKSNIISASTCSSWDESQCSKKISQRFSPVKTKTRAFSNVDRPIASLIEARGSSVDPDLGNHWRSRFRTSADSVSLRSASSITRSSLVSTESESRSGESRSLGTNTHRSGMQRSLSAENYFLRMAFSAGARQYDKHLRECRPNDKTCVEGAFRRRAEETKKTQTETDSSETIRKEYKGVGTHRSEEGAKQEREEEKRLNGGEKARDNKVKKGDEKLKTDGEARPKQIEGKEKLKVYDKVKPKKKGMGAEKLEADEEISPKKKGKGAEKLEADEEISPKKKGKGAEKLYADEEISPEKKGKDAEKLYVDEEISPKKKGKGAEKLEADEAATPKKKGKSAGKLEADEEVSSKKKKAGGKLKVDDEVKPKKKGKDAGKLKIDEEERPDQEEESEELEEEKDARPKKTGKEHEQFKLNEETRPKGKDAEDGKKVEGGIPKRQEIEQDKTKDSRARKENEEKRVSKNEQGKAMRDREEGLRDDRPRRQKEDHTRKYAEQELGSEVERGDSNTEINQNKQTDTTYPKQKKAVPDSAGKKKTVEKKETQVSPRQVKTHQIKPTNSIIYDAALKFFRATGMTYFATVS